MKVIAKDDIQDVIDEELENLRLMDDARLKSIKIHREQIIMLESEMKATDYTRRVLKDLLARTTTIEQNATGIEADTK